MVVHVYIPGIQEAECEGQASLDLSLKKENFSLDPLAFLIRIFILLPCSS